MANMSKRNGRVKRFRWEDGGRDDDDRGASQVGDEADDRYDWRKNGYVGDRDALEARSEEDLCRLDDQLKRRIDWARDRSERKSLETELCYVQREIHVRKRRAEIAAELAAKTEA